MAGLGLSEILVLLFLGYGGQSADLASVLNADAYFRSRGIEASVAKMAELAARDPVDGKTQIQQLLALRYLEANAAALKNAKNSEKVRKLVEQIAQGIRAQDKLGFAQEAAARVLARLQGKAIAFPLPDNSVRAEAWSWFPADSSLILSLDARGLHFAAATQQEHLPPLMPLLTMQLDPVYKFAEKVGNVRIERLALAYADAPKNPKQSRIFNRITGKLNHDWFAKYLQQEAGLKVQSKKGTKGETITTIDKTPPACAIIGNTDPAG